MGGDVPRERAWAWAAGWAVVLAAAQASAANLVEVRVGRHAQFTRVVLETDAPVRYELSRDATGEVRVRLFAAAEPRRLGSKSPLLREVVVESDPAGSVARLALKDAPVDVHEMVLQKPPRIVLDLVPGARGARKAAPVVARAEAPPAPRVEAPAPAPAEPPREIAAEPEPERAGEASPPAPAAEPPKATAREQAAAEAELERAAPEPSQPAPGAPPDAAALERARDAAAQAELDRLAGIAPPPEVAPEAGEGAPGAGAEAPSEAAEPEEVAGVEEAPGDAGADADRERAEGEPTDEAGAEAMLGQPFAPGPPPSAGPSFLPSPLDDPLVLGAVAVLGALVGVLLVLRRRAGRGAREALASPFASAEGFAVPPRAEGAPRASEAWAAPGGAPVASDAAVGPLFASAAAPDAEPEKEEPSIFDVAEETVRAADPTPATPAFSAAEPRAATASLGSVGSAALEGDVMRIIEELERRLAHLETRFEEVVDAKERLERHVAAQTEELRVQRAAIARTQRVLRTVVKPEDLATEPIPKP
jgi:hypothetical protein